MEIGTELELLLTVMTALLMRNANSSARLDNIEQAMLVCFAFGKDFYLALTGSLHP